MGFEDGYEVGLFVDEDMMETTGLLGAGIVGFALGFKVGFRVGGLVGCFDRFGLGGRGGGGRLLAIVADSYSTVQLGTEKHPSLSAQNLDAKPPGHGLLSKHFPLISVN